MMSMKQMTFHRVRMTLNDPFMTSFGTLQEKDFFIIALEDEAGNIGYGESVAFISPWYTEETVETSIHMWKDFLIPLLKQQPISHPRELSAIFSPIKRNNMAKAAIEGAVWDLYAKQQALPLSKIVGGTKSEIEVGISLGIEPSVKLLLKKIDHYVQAGYKRIKLKIKPGHDVEMLREVRHHFPDVPLMADANSAYTLEDIDHLRKLDDLNLLMIEQPLAHDDIVDHATLQRRLKTPICLDESIHSFDDARHAIALGSCEIINIKSGRVGGITEAIRIHDLAREKNIAVWCGGMLEAGIGRAHNIALASLAQFVLPGDIGGSSRYWKKDIIEPEVVVQNGLIKVPTKPGIGYDINQEVLHQFTTDMETFKL